MSDHETQLTLITARVREVERDLYDAREQLRDVVLSALEGGISEANAARLTGLSRTTVRAWRAADAYDAYDAPCNCTNPYCQV